MTRLTLSLMLCLASSVAHADDWVIGSEAVVNVKLSDNTDPIPAALEPALRQSQALRKKYPKATQWLINVAWPAAPTGVQFIARGSSRSFAGMSPGIWLGLFQFNGGSENGVIEADRWCLRGAARTYPDICRGIDEAVERRNVRALVRR